MSLHGLHWSPPTRRSGRSQAAGDPDTTTQAAGRWTGQGGLWINAFRTPARPQVSTHPCLMAGSELPGALASERAVPSEGSPGAQETPGVCQLQAALLRGSL